MPTIGWFEILIVVAVAIIVIGPKDFPIVLKKIGNWVSSVKRYFNEMKIHIESFRTAQQEVENIAHSPKNIPSINLLLTEAAPKAKQIIESITTLINEEASLDATEQRKHLLKLLADSRGSFALSLAKLACSFCNLRVESPISRCNLFKRATFFFICLAFAFNPPICAKVLKY